MRYLIIIIFLIISTCKQSEKKQEASGYNFYCGNQEVKERSFFKKMKSINYFKNLRTGDFEKKKVQLLNKQSFDSSIDSYYDDIYFNIKISPELKAGIYDKITLRNDSVFLFNNFFSLNLLVFKSNFTNDKACCYSKLSKVVYDPVCKDSIYKFQYNFRFESHSENDEGLKEIWASRDRGILRVVYKDSLGDLWQGQYYPSLSEE